MDEGIIEKGGDDDAISGGDDVQAPQLLQQQPPTGDTTNRGLMGDPGYYYHQHFSPIPYGYHLTEEQWAAHEHNMQHLGYQYQQHYG